jgi:hypothetical protein
LLKNAVSRRKLLQKVRYGGQFAHCKDIVDAIEKLVLGMTFQIIIKYLKFEDDDGNSSGDVKGFAQ